MRPRLWITIVTLLLMVPPSLALAGTIREVVVGPHDIVAVNTALGLSTMIELPKSPKSVIVGDLDAFRVEYAGQAVAIKPLLPGAKSNLFVATAEGAYRFQLQVVGQPGADYVIRITPKKRGVPVLEAARPPSGQAPGPKGVGLGTVTSENFEFSVQSLRAYDKGGKIGISFSIAVPSLDSGSNGLDIRPEDIHVTQDGRELPIFLLALDSSKASRLKPVAGLAVMIRQDLNPNSPLVLSFCPKDFGSCTEGIKVSLQKAKAGSRSKEKASEKLHSKG